MNAEQQGVSGMVQTAMTAVGVAMAVGLTLMICYGACGCTFLTKGNDGGGGGHQKLETTEERADEKDEKDALDSAESGGRKKKRREKAVVTADGMD